MKVKLFVVLGLVVAYVASMLVGIFTVAPNKPQFPVPEYLAMYGPDRDKPQRMVYEERGKYYLETSTDEIEITYGEFLRLACIYPENFEICEDMGYIKEVDGSSTAQSMIEIKYPDDKKAKQYDVIFNNVYSMPCWQLIWSAQILMDDDDAYVVNRSLQTTFDTYGVTSGSFYGNISVNLADQFFYGDSIEQLYSYEDCYDEDIYYQILGEAIMYELYEEGDRSEKDLTNNYDKMLDLIKDETGTSLKKLLLEEYDSPYIHIYDPDRKTFTSELYIALGFISPARAGHPSIFLEEDSINALLGKYYTYTDAYEISGYYRYFVSEDQIVIICIADEENSNAVIIANDVDPLVRKQFVKDVVEIVFDEKDEGVTGTPVQNAHRILRAVVITSVFVVLLVIAIVIFVILSKKKKKVSPIDTNNDPVVIMGDVPVYTGPENENPENKE